MLDFVGIDPKTGPGRRSIALKLALDYCARPVFHADRNGFDLKVKNDIGPIIAAADHFVEFLDGDTAAPWHRVIALQLGIEFAGRPVFHADRQGFDLKTKGGIEAVITAAHGFLGFLKGDTVTLAADLAASVMGDLMTANMIRANLYVLDKSDAQFNETVGADTCTLTLGIDSNNPEQQKLADSNMLLFGTASPSPVTLTIANSIADQFQVGTCVPIGLLPNGDPSQTWSTNEATAEASDRVTA
jgi:hypothetical protein